VEYKTVRRVVVGHNSQGKAVALFDGPTVPKQRSPGGNAVLNLWVTNEFPVELSGAADKAETKVGVPPPENGTIFRIVEFPPTSTTAVTPHGDHARTLTAMGIDPATQGHARHPNTHRTRSIDYPGEEPGQLRAYLMTPRTERARIMHSASVSVHAIKFMTAASALRAP
jgi:hypothetical protein